MKLMEMVWHLDKTGKFVSVQGLIYIPQIKDLKIVMQKQKEQHSNIIFKIPNLI